MSHEKLVLLETHSGVATITLNRPERLNSLTVPMHEALRDALDRVAADPELRCVLLTGAGRGFCAGQDLSDPATMGNGEAPDLGHTLETYYNPLVRRLRSLEKPVVCAVNGVAAGAGANLALACDLVLAARSASFIQAFCKIGLAPDCGGSYFLPRLVGSARAMGLAMLGEKLSAEQAADWGLIWRCIDDEQLLPEAKALAANLASGPTRGLALIKQEIHASIDNDLETQLNLERDLQRQAGQTEDHREGVNAFLEKRKPCYRGR